MLKLLRRLVRHITSNDYEVEARLDPETVIIHDIPVVDSSVKYVPEAVFSKKGLFMTMKNDKPVHKAPQFPCNHYMPIETMKDSNSSRYWAKVTCKNCLRSRLKKQYDNRREQSTKKQIAHTMGKALVKDIDDSLPEHTIEFEGLYRDGKKIEEAW